MEEKSPQKHSWLDRPLLSIFPALTGEVFLFVVILALAALSRLYGLGTRLMSHDETLHVYFSWLFSQGQGYAHSPLMHGPLQFHLLALTYFLFGASDFTARFPHALASILAIFLLWKWRRYLGRAGTLVAALGLLISPYLLYYGRYARNEAFIGIFFVLTLYAVLRYLETGKLRYLILLTVATALHFTAKETAFIYTAQLLLFLTFYLVNRVTRLPWRTAALRTPFLVALGLGALCGGAALGLTSYNLGQAAALLFALTGAAWLAAVVLLLTGYGWKNLKQERALDMLFLLATFVLPQLAAFPVKALGWNPLEYQFTWPGFDLPALWAQGPVRTAAVFALLTALSVVLGLLWDKKRWFICSLIFWGIYVFFYTSMLTNWQGFFTGSVGSLGYWLEQQGVHRGDQPWYYYLLIQIPVYEFLPALGLGLAAYFGLRKKSPASLPNDQEQQPETGSTDTPEKLTFPLLFWWAISSLLAFSLAGEKMPWLSVHIALPMILLTGWAVGQIVERMDWSAFRKRRSVWITLLLVVFLIGICSAVLKAFGAHPPFQGKALEQLAATNAFLLAAGITLVSAFGLVYLLAGWKVRDVLRLATLIVFGLLVLLTARTALRAAFINYDNATEYLVYAHGASGIDDVMQQVSKISSRVAGEKNLQLAYDANLPSQGVSWSFKWYLREYPNTFSFDKPDDSLRDVPVIIVDQNNFDNIEPIVQDNYYSQEYVRMAWPNQDYLELTWPRLQSTLADPAMREALIEIWLNRDFTSYAQVTGETSLTLATWQPARKMRLYIRKDIAAQIWEFGLQQAAPLQIDPYEQSKTTLIPDLIIGSPGNAPGELNAPRSISIAPDGSLYVADSGNNRIERFDAEGNFLLAWGEASEGCPYTTVPSGEVASGTFCEPWGVAVSPDGEWVYVADTWNHRIQKFTAEGDFAAAWGTPNYDPASSGPFGLWGPRGIAVDNLGRVFVADSGNKRILIYDADGHYLGQIGSQGIATGQLDEPVGMAFDGLGNLYAADTWNQRVQVFAPNVDGVSYTSVTQWDIAGWNSQSLDNKPYLALDDQGHVFVTDPEGYRVLEFGDTGSFIQTWGDYGTAPESFGLASGIAVDSQGRVWVSDAGNNRLMRFTLP